MPAGTVRTLEDTGRLVVPASIRARFGLGVGAPMAFFVDDEERRIVLMPLASACVFCGAGETLLHHHGKPVCGACRARMARRALRVRLSVAGERPPVA
jgi:transcriptional pleiotropic regulator of transition state genes